jgi:hypothetical protein
MSTTLIFLTFVMVVVILILVIVGLSYGWEFVKTTQADIEVLRSQDDFHEHAEVPAEQTGEFPSVSEPGTIPLDPNNPPKLKVYRGPAGKRQCNCHGADVQQDQKVWLWPRPDFPGRVDIYCESWMKEQGERA